MKFGDNLRNLRLKRGLTQMEFAEQLGSTQSSVTAWECGRRDPDFATVSRIAKFFGVPMQSLLSSADVNDVPDENVIEFLHSNPKLRLLFDKSRHLSESDLDAVLAVVNAISRERNDD